MLLPPAKAGSVELEAANRAEAELLEELDGEMMAEAGGGNLDEQWKTEKD